MDKASIIDDSIAYIQSLQKKIKEAEAHVSAYQATTLQYSSSISCRIESAEAGNYEKRPTKSQVDQGFKIMEVSLHSSLCIKLYATLRFNEGVS